MKIISLILAFTLVNSSMVFAQEDRSLSEKQVETVLANIQQQQHELDHELVALRSLQVSLANAKKDYRLQDAVNVTIGIGTFTTFVTGGIVGLRAFVGYESTVTKVGGVVGFVVGGVSLIGFIVNVANSSYTMSIKEDALVPLRSAVNLKLDTIAQKQQILAHLIDSLKLNTKTIDQLGNSTSIVVP